MLDLEYEYNRELEERLSSAEEREIFEDRLMESQRYFEKWAGRYVKEAVGLEPFIEWCWEKFARELTPQWTRAWEDDRELPSKMEYWNFDGHGHL